jgi:FAD synthetase
LRTFNLSYCKLYDQGYTSLGKQADTQRNPALRKNKYIDRRGEQDSEQVGDFYPAYMLADWSLERAGRGMTEAKSGKRMVEGRMDVSSAGMIIIGDEILNGFTSDSNLLITSTALGNVGVPLRRVVVVSDDEEEISREIRRMSQEFDLVITSGGIGPTHDDVTIKAVATAFGESIEANPLMLDHLDKAHTASGSKEPMRSSFLRLADLPSKSQLRFPPPTGNESRLMWPILQYDNVFVLPGVPEFFADKIATITRHFIIPRKSFFSRKIVLSIEEKDIVGALDDAVAAHPRGKPLILITPILSIHCISYAVKFGSYPFVNRTDYKTILTVQGEEEEEVEAAVNQLLEAIPAQAVVSVLGSLL